jgi:hypothetical protein
MKQPLMSLPDLSSAGSVSIFTLVPIIERRNLEIDPEYVYVHSNNRPFAYCSKAEYDQAWHDRNSTNRFCSHLRGGFLQNRRESGR